MSPNSSKKMEVKITLVNEEVDRFMALKRRLGFRKNAAVIRHKLFQEPAMLDETTERLEVSAE